MVVRLVENGGNSLIRLLYGSVVLTEFIVRHAPTLTVKDGCNIKAVQCPIVSLVL